jgi:hypothetical protein
MLIIYFTMDTKWKKTPSGQVELRCLDVWEITEIGNGRQIIPEEQSECSVKVYWQAPKY